MEKCIRGLLSMKSMNTRSIRGLLNRKVVNDSRLVKLDSRECCAIGKMFKNSQNFKIFMMKY